MCLVCVCVCVFFHALIASYSEGLCELGICALGWGLLVVGEGKMNMWDVEPFCYIWVLGEYGDRKLACVFLLYEGFEAYDGCSIGFFL